MAEIEKCRLRGRMPQPEKQLALANRFLEREQRVIEMLIAVGFVSRQKVEQAREISDSLRD